MTTPEQSPRPIDRDGLLNAQAQRPPLDPSVWDIVDVEPEPQAQQTSPGAPKRYVLTSESLDQTQVMGQTTVQQPRSNETITYSLKDRLKALGAGAVVVSITIVGVLTVNSKSQGGKRAENVTSTTEFTPLNTTGTTSTIEASSTTTSPEQSCDIYIVKKGDTLTSIAELLSKRCTNQGPVTISQLMLYNNISDADVIAEGQVLYFSGAIPTTTLAPTSVPPTEAPTTVVPSTLAPTTTPTTIPSTTVSPTTIATTPATTAPAPMTPNDGKLSPEECAALGGEMYSFHNETFIQLFKKQGYTEQQALKIYNAVKVTFKLVNIYDDIPGDPYNLQECKPTRAKANQILGI